MAQSQSIKSVPTKPHKPVTLRRVNLRCAQCGERFTFSRPSNKGGAYPMYCGDTCRTTAKQEQIAAWRERNPMQ